MIYLCFFNYRPMNRLGMRQIVWIPRLSACLGTFITVQRSPLTSISFASTNSIIGFTDLQLSMVVLGIKCKNYTIFTDRVVTVTHLKNNIYWRQAVRTRTRNNRTKICCVPNYTTTRQNTHLFSQTSVCPFLQLCLILKM